MPVIIPLIVIFVLFGKKNSKYKYRNTEQIKNTNVPNCKTVLIITFVFKLFPLVI